MNSDAESSRQRFLRFDNTANMKYVRTIFLLSTKHNFRPLHFFLSKTKEKWTILERLKKEDRICNLNNHRKGFMTDKFHQMMTFRKMGT